MCVAISWRAIVRGACTVAAEEDAGVILSLDIIPTERGVVCRDECICVYFSPPTAAAPVVVAVAVAV